MEQFLSVGPDVHSYDETPPAGTHSYSVKAVNSEGRERGVRRGGPGDRAAGEPGLHRSGRPPGDRSGRRFAGAGARRPVALDRRAAERRRRAQDRLHPEGRQPVDLHPRQRLDDPVEPAAARRHLRPQLRGDAGDRPGDGRLQVRQVSPPNVNQATDLGNATGSYSADGTITLTSRPPRRTTWRSASLPAMEVRTFAVNVSGRRRRRRPRSITPIRRTTRWPARPRAEVSRGGGIRTAARARARQTGGKRLCAAFD